MERTYAGLPAAASMEQSIVLAQLMILRDLARRRPGDTLQGSERLSALPSSVSGFGWASDY